IYPTLTEIPNAKARSGVVAPDDHVEQIRLKRGRRNLLRVRGMVASREFQRETATRWPRRRKDRLVFRDAQPPVYGCREQSHFVCYLIVEAGSNRVEQIRGRDSIVGRIDGKRRSEIVDGNAKLIGRVHRGDLEQTAGVVHVEFVLPGRLPGAVQGNDGDRNMPRIWQLTEPAVVYDSLVGCAVADNAMVQRNLNSVTEARADIEWIWKLLRERGHLPSGTFIAVPTASRTTTALGICHRYLSRL